MDVRPGRQLRFGDFELDVRARELRRQGVRVRLQDQSFLILLMLLERPGDVVLREEIRQKLWPSDTIVEFDHSINAAIKRLRQALGEAAEHPRYIETLAKRGYRFSGQVNGDADEPPETLPDPAAAIVAEAVREAPPQPHLGRRFGATPVLSGLFAVMAVVALMYPRHRPPEQRVVRFEITPPENDRFAGDDTPVVSPDGTEIVFSAGNRGALFLRTLDSPAPRKLAGTEGGHMPFWSPDGRSLGFFAGGKLKKMSPLGSPPLVLCDVENSKGGAWGRDDVIIFGRPFPPFALVRIAAGGGKPAPITTGENRHAWPSFLPDGNHFLFTVYAADSSKSGVFVGSLDSPHATRLLPDETNAQYTEPGYLVFRRGGDLMAQPFDAKNLRLSGEPFLLAQEIAEEGNLAFSAFSASAGVLAYRTGGARGPSKLEWFDRQGKALGDVGPAGQYDTPAISPDGKMVAVASRNPSPWDIWSFDLMRGTRSRLTFGGVDHSFPAWSPDGRQIAYALHDKSHRIVHRLVNGAGTDEVVSQLDRDADVEQWTGNGRDLILTVHGSENRQEIWVVPVSGGGKPSPVITGAFGYGAGRVSPDGKWMAYTASDTGGPEIYIQDFPPTRGERQIKSQISNAGGRLPKWRADGRELFYREGSKVISVAVKTNVPKFEAGIPKLLFDVPRSQPFFDVSPDGEKLLLVVSNEETGAPRPISVVTNWPAARKR
jgi:eukaryotic-like serine/threonine-protein kinase